MNINSKLEFHQTFQPEFVYISKILELAVKGYSGSKQDISECTGIPTGKQKGKVEPHIKYAEYMGLIKYSYNNSIYSLATSDLGNEVFMQDRYLHESLTRWLCHYGISREGEGAPQWTYIVRGVHCGFVESISQDFLFTRAINAFNTTINPKDIVKKIFGVVRSSYITGCFSNLEYLTWEVDISYNEHNENIEFLFLYAYAFLRDWENIFPDKYEITMMDIQKKICLDKVFGFTTEELNYVLDSLVDEGIISINRQLYPMTVIKTSHSEEMIPQLYSRLI